MKTYSTNQLERYPVYLKYFKELKEEGIEIISSPKIAAKLGYSEEQVRKDLQNVSLEPGRPKKGRSINQLIDDLEAFLGYRSCTSAVLIGVGHLGGALLNFPAFKEMGLEIVAGFDLDPQKIGTNIGGKPIYDFSSFGEVLPGLNAQIAILCVPSGAANDVAKTVLSNGVRAIWNFAPTHLDLPENVVVENVNLASSLAILNHKLSLMLARDSKRAKLK